MFASKLTFSSPELLATFYAWFVSFMPKAGFCLNGFPNAQVHSFAINRRPCLISVLADAFVEPIELINNLGFEFILERLLSRLLIVIILFVV